MSSRMTRIIAITSISSRSSSAQKLTKGASIAPARLREEQKRSKLGRTCKDGVNFGISIIAGFLLFGLHALLWVLYIWYLIKKLNSNYLAKLLYIIFLLFHRVDEEVVLRDSFILPPDSYDKRKKR